MSRAALLAVFLLGGWAQADPPKLVVPDAPIEAKPGRLSRLSVETDAKSCVWVVSDPDEADLIEFPDGRTAIFASTVPGTYTVTVVAASESGQQKKAAFKVKVEGTPPPPTVPPPTTPPTQPPTQPPPTPGAGLYFLVVRADGPSPPGFTDYMSHPGWSELRKLGHKAKDKTVTEAAQLGIAIPAGTTLPCVVTLRARPDGKSDIVRGPVPAPAPADIAKLAGGL